jgi:hypothetical protein
LCPVHLKVFITSVFEHSLIKSTCKGEFITLICSLYLLEKYTFILTHPYDVFYSRVTQPGVCKLYLGVLNLSIFYSSVYFLFCIAVRFKYFFITFVASMLESEHDEINILLLPRHYSPGWALASLTMRLYSSLLHTFSHHRPTCITLRSYSKSCNHLFLGLPRLLLPSIKVKQSRYTP